MQKFSVGQQQLIRTVISTDDLNQFAELSGDFAPLHTNRDFAIRAGFEGVVVHGAFLTALLSRLVGMVFPGPCSVLERLDLNFRQPCYAPCEVCLTGTVKQISEAVNSLILEINISDSQGRVLVTGKTWHRILDLEIENE